MPPLSISHGSLLQIVTAPPVPGNVTGWKRRTNQSPPCQRGVPRHRRGGGIPWPKPRTSSLFPIPSSLFTKKPSPFHIGLYLRKVPTVNPSVKNQRFLPAPFDKGAFGVHRPKPPLLKGGASACRGGGIPWPKPRTSSLFPIHFSLKNLSLSTLVCTLGKCLL